MDNSVFVNKLLELIGMKVNKVIAGGSNGSIVIIDLNNSAYSLFVKCVWRLHHGNVVLTGWNESNDASAGNMTIEIKKLINDEIVEIKISPFYDLVIQFKSGKVLSTFSDVTPKYEPDYYDENWIFCDVPNNLCYTINKYYQITTSPFR